MCQDQAKHFPEGEVLTCLYNKKNTQAISNVDDSRNYVWSDDRCVR